ncbi:MAG: lipoprotein [bacterium]|nr:lipoprotein [bacterium]
MKKYILLIVIVVLLTACKRKPIIPEISPSLKNETIFELKDNDDVAAKLIDNKADLVFFTVKGKIFRFNIKERMLTFLSDLTLNLEQDVFNQKACDSDSDTDVAVLRKKDKSGLVVFDTGTMKVLKILDSLTARQIICVDREILGFLSEQRLVFYHLPTGKTLREVEIDKSTVFFNSKIKKKTAHIYILASDAFYIYNKAQNSLKTLPLKYKASSGFLLDGSSVYYGSDDRRLVRLSIPRNRVKWAFRLSDKLQLAPLKAGPYIFIAPRDNNVYFFNKRGTLYWWEKLNSTRLLPPVKMEENVAIFLWNKTFRFYDHKKRRVKSFSFEDTIHSTPIHLDNYLYMLADAEEQFYTDKVLPKVMAKIGNYYTVEIETDPEHIIPMGKSIKFYLKKINLVYPQYNIKILDPAGKAVFEKSIDRDDEQYFVWIPEKAVRYRVAIEIIADNVKGIIVEHPFDVIDIEKKLGEFYYNLQKYSKEDQFHKVHDKTAVSEQTEADESAKSTDSTE